MSNSESGQTKPETVPEGKTIREGRHFLKVQFCYGCQSCMSIDSEDPEFPDGKLLRSEHAIGISDVTPEVSYMMSLIGQLHKSLTEAGVEVALNKVEQP